MNDHYYTREPGSESRPVSCEYSFRGLSFRFETDSGVFSKGETDPGTRLLLESLPEEVGGDVLDLGCGWGIIGTCVAKRWPGTKVCMADVNLRALELSRKNLKANGAGAEVLESDGMSALMDRRFDLILTNPPIRAGKSVIYRMFADAAACLRDGGALVLVIRKQQGAESCMRYLDTIYSRTEKIAKSGGYWVIRAEK